MIIAFAGLLVTCFSGQTIDEKIQGVLPDARDTKYLTIPWRMNLMRARLEAQEQGKPLFLWIMNGHPFGAT